MAATTSKRGKPWALLAVLGGIGLGTVGMCSVGGWLVVHSVQAGQRAEDARRGPLEVRSEAYRVVMRRTAPERNVELFDGALARDAFQNTILRRFELSCDARLRVLAVGVTSQVVPWMDFAASATSDGEPTQTSIAGLDASQRRYLNSSGEPFTVVGFIRGPIFYALDIRTDDPSCVARAVASIEMLDGEAVPPRAAELNVTRPTFRIVNNRYEGLVSGLVVESPEPFTFAEPERADVWVEQDEVVLLHPNGTELHFVTSGTTERDRASSCATPTLDQGSRPLDFAGAQRQFVSGPSRAHWWAMTWYCIEQMRVVVTAHGPTEARTDEAIQAMGTPLRHETFTSRNDGSSRRAGGVDWSFYRDTYAHFGSGLTWHRPSDVDVQLMGVVRPRGNYPEPDVQFAFVRRDLTAHGAAWVHRTEMTDADYHAAFVRAASASQEYVDPERIDREVQLGDCRGTRSELASYESRVFVVTCVQNGWAVALEVGGISDAASADFANEAIAAFIVGTPSDAASFRVEGATVEVNDDSAHADISRNRLALHVQSHRSWSPVTVLAQAVVAAQQAGAFGDGLHAIQISRVFASTTPVTHTEVSGLAAEERRIVIEDRALRVYTVVVDATAYVITLHGPVSTPESAWTELLATVHIDP